MTTTYPDDAPIEVKTLEEMRCLRCVMERILRVMDEGLFVDYQMEKFGNKYKQDATNMKESNTILCPTCKGAKKVPSKELGLSIMCPDCQVKAEPKSLCPKCESSNINLIHELKSHLTHNRCVDCGNIWKDTVKAEPKPKDVV